jgi:peptidoglycan hydrolase CwlO-like protein
MMSLAQAAESASGFTEILSVGGPISGILAAIAFLTRLWLDSRKQKREDKASDRQSETGIVETTRAALQMVRDQMTEMNQDIAVLRAQVKDRDDEIQKLQDIVRQQQSEIAVLRAQVTKGRGI